MFDPQIFFKKGPLDPVEDDAEGQPTGKQPEKVDLGRGGCGDGLGKLVTV